MKASPDAPGPDTSRRGEAEGLFHPRPGGELAALLALLLILGFYLLPWSWTGFLWQGLAGYPATWLAAIVRLAKHGLADLACVGMIFLAAWGCGSIFARRVTIPWSPGEQTLTAIALGLGFMAQGVFLLGLVQGYSQWGWWTAWLLVLLAATRGVALLLAAVKPMVSRPLQPEAGGLLTGLALVLLVPIILARATYPAVFYDALTYHLGVPNYYLQEGGICYLPGDSCSNFPFLAEMIYTLGMLLGGLGTAQLSNLLILFLVAWAGAMAGGAVAGRWGRRMGLLLGLSLPGFLESSVLYTNDLHLALWGFLAFWSWTRSPQDHGNSRLKLCGVFTGLALGTKYLALILVLLPLGGLILADGLRSKEGKRGILSRLASFSLPALVVACPGYLKNLVYTGNPFYPAWFGLFGGRDMNPQIYQSILVLAHRPSLSDSLVGLFLHPVRLFFAGPEHLNQLYGAAANLGPWAAILVVSAAGLLLRRRFQDTPVTVAEHGQAVGRLVAAGGLVYLLWAFSFTQVRYGYLWVMLFIPAGLAGLGDLVSKARPLTWWLATATLTFCLVLNATLGFHMSGRWTEAPVLAKVDESDDEYLSRRLGGPGVFLDSYPLMAWINQNLPPQSVVLIIGDAQHLYLNRRHRYAYLSATAPFDVMATAPSPDAVASSLSARGITHVLYNPLELRRLQEHGAIHYPAAANGNIETFLASPRVKKVASSGPPSRPVSLYQID